MIVIAETSPLNYRILIGAAEVLQPLYGRVIVPITVVEELTKSGTPYIVRIWVAEAPPWLEVRPDPPLDSALDFLDPGEKAALQLAQILKADRLLIDDRAGGGEAKRRRLSITGTLGVLAHAYVAGLLDFDKALVLLRSTNFRLHPDVELLVRRRILAQEKESPL